MPSKPTLTVAFGDDLYAVERPFGDLGAADGKVADVTVDRAGRVHVLLRRDALVDAPGPAVVVFDQDGRRLGAWGEAILDAHMIACDRDGRLWVVDRDAHEIVAYDAEGRRLAALGRAGAPGQPFNHPADIAFSPSGDIYVADGYGHGFVHRFGPDLAAKGRWGRVGTRPGEFLTVHGIWVTPDERVLVVDRENSRIQVFDPEGQPLGLLTMFYRPSDIWGDAAGRLYVSDAIPTVTRLEPVPFGSNRSERTGPAQAIDSGAFPFGSDDSIRSGNALGPDLGATGRCRPVLNGAHGLWGDAAGRLYLAEGNPSRVTRLVPKSG